MPIIKIQPDSVRQQGSRLSQTASDLTALHWEINRLANQLDWEVRGKGHVEAKISEAATLGKKLYEEAQRLSEYLKTCAAALEDADSQGQQGISATMSTASLGTGLVVGSSVVGAGVLAGLIAGGKCNIFPFTSLKWLKNAEGSGTWIRNARARYLASRIYLKPSSPPIVGMKLDTMKHDESYVNTNGIVKTYYDDLTKTYHSSNCTWWAAARYKETHNGQIFGTFGNSIYTRNPISCGDAPQSGSIAVFKGHVAFVEYVDGSDVYYSEANVSSKTDFTIQKLKISEFESLMGGTQFYIY